MTNLVCSDGRVLPLDVAGWLCDAAPEERRVLERAQGPVLDIGCGPGRHVLALGDRGVLALGVDVAEMAVQLAHGRGALALRRSVFERVPGAGRWATALLLDGNIGIGGDPVALLGRTAELLQSRGRALVEVDAPGGVTATVTARIDNGAVTSRWFRWSLVAADDVARIAVDSGFDVEDIWPQGERWFASLSAT
ncbi:MAG: SAM-dependent methyltransferase [Actinomycetota bacterium]